MGCALWIHRLPKQTHGTTPLAAKGDAGIDDEPGDQIAVCEIERLTPTFIGFAKPADRLDASEAFFAFHLFSLAMLDCETQPAAPVANAGDQMP
ncbi:hypothetical protein [Roseobacter weihaiensis]|uniref:hypothetical protein n=1 Tax=Roseobacter weihaiensis TaxID=2763262 RepID=UPI001D09D1FF|nr:hypothetical protein [Roseobacter sp. H9]